MQAMSIKTKIKLNYKICLLKFSSNLILTNQKRNRNKNKNKQNQKIIKLSCSKFKIIYNN